MQLELVGSLQCTSANAATAYYLHVHLLHMSINHDHIRIMIAAALALRMVLQNLIVVASE